MTKISVIIPCYNVEKYLDQCLTSVMNQTLRDIEIICVDDGSTDHTLKMLNSYAEQDKRVRVFSQQNQFAGAAWNLGLSRAKGEYLIFLDSNDFLSETLAQDAYTAAVSADADVVLFDAQFFDESANEFRKGWFLNTRYIPEKQPFNYKDCPECFYQITSPVPWTKMFRRQFLLDTRLQFQTLRHTNDTFFIMSALAMAERIVTLDKVLVNYRVGHATNLQSTKRKNPFCFYTAYKAWHDKLEELGVLPALHRSYANQALSGCLDHLCTLNDPDVQKKFFDQLCQEIFRELELPDEASCYYIDEHYNQMSLIKNGTFEQYRAYQTSTIIRDMWNSAEQGCRMIQSTPHGSKERQVAIRSAVESVLKAIKTYIPDKADPNAKYAYQMAHDVFNREEFSDVSIQMIQNRVRYQEFGAIRRNDYETIQDMLRRKLIVSMTSYPARIHGLEPVLESLFKQNRKADEIVLWLAEEQFPGKEQDLPEYLTGLVKRNKLTIRWCDDLKPHKKYFYAFQAYPNDLIVTVDDDLIYSRDMLSALHNSYLMYPDAVSAVRVHLMIVSEDNKILPYNRWVRETECCLYTPCMQLLATCGAGALFPPELFRKEFLDRDAIIENSLNADDLWLKAMQIMSGVPVVMARRYEPLVYAPGSQQEALWHSNVSRNQNDVQMENIIRWTDRVFGKNALVRALTDPAQFHPILDKETMAYYLNQERQVLRQQFYKKERALLEAETKQRDTEAKQREAEAKLREAEVKRKNVEAKLQEAERKLKDSDQRLKDTQRKLKTAEESKPITCQMKELGKELKGLREKGHSSLSVRVKLLIYKIAWIPEKILVFLMYYLRNGAKQTIKYFFRK